MDSTLQQILAHLFAVSQQLQEQEQRIQLLTTENAQLRQQLSQVGEANSS